ncbi:hypothetical protein ASF01_04765 [Stenotrophomonas sp. Leaf70]|uniref:Uncharacterized protein n=1 Tax=Stenotrophomonas nitritireducens TaxID=83617 RepID=A0ABR5NJF5_9GAMM|nr:hypothetical protein ASF01_04765 [Stenotrophomonas sp. Leaf70]KRG56833.1 hypothetical protein ABB22_10285 [Stenotrophomonas nitritireducens]
MGIQICQCAMYTLRMTMGNGDIEGRRMIAPAISLIASGTVDAPLSALTVACAHAFRIKSSGSRRMDAVSCLPAHVDAGALFRT